MNQNTDIHKQTGVVRTDVYCTNCSKNFVARIDFDVNGNHIIECPLCAHEHCRVITNGVITGERWDSRYQRVDVKPRNTWSHQSLPVTTSVACNFLRDRWINRSDLGED